MPEIPIIYGGFVIRDYKFDSGIRRPKHKGRLRLLSAIGVLAATIGAVSYINLGAITNETTPPAAAPANISAILPIPDVQLSGIEASTDNASETPTTRIGEPSLLAGTTKNVALAPQLPSAEAPPASDAQLSESLANSAVESDVPVATLASLDTQESAEQAPSILQGEDIVAAETTNLRWVDHKIAKGESLARIFSEQGLDARLLHRIVTSGDEAKSLANIRPGQKLRFQFDETNELVRLELHRNRVDSMRISISDDEIKIEEVSKALETRVASTAGMIQSSLFVDGQKAGLSDSQIMELATIFGWDIDFALEIRAGDQFRVLYEEQYLDGEKLRNGQILAAEFTNRGQTHRALRYEDNEGEVGYYDANGDSKRRAFIRTPIKFARVSSGFTVRRWHPILKKWRSHKGVDYAAPKGTPVKATGDGRVIFRGKKSGYGNVVIVEHAGTYTTLYAHLNGFSKRAQNGNRVKQGQVIGYVGMTGLATGPHLHYEFRVNGQHRNPLKVKLPKSLALPKAELAKFRSTTAPLLAKLEAIPADTMVASAGGAQTNP